MIRRPITLKEIAERSESIEDFGRNLRDWLHELRKVSSRPLAIRAIAEKPATLRSQFASGEVADAWLAAYAEYVSTRLEVPPPSWAFDRSRVAQKPWFADDLGSSSLRLLALQRSPLPFKRRNLYASSVELPLRLRAGRPPHSIEEKRKANAERQRRFRARRKIEFSTLRRSKGSS
jgi:hypothetical protein